MRERAALIEVDFPVSGGPEQTTIGHPEYNCKGDYRELYQQQELLTFIIVR